MTDITIYCIIITQGILLTMTTLSLYYDNKQTNKKQDANFFVTFITKQENLLCRSMTHGCCVCWVCNGKQQTGRWARAGKLILVTTSVPHQPACTSRTFHWDARHAGCQYNQLQGTKHVQYTLFLRESYIISLSCLCFYCDQKFINSHFSVIHEQGTGKKRALLLQMCKVWGAGDSNKPACAC